MRIRTALTAIAAVAALAVPASSASAATPPWWQLYTAINAVRVNHGLTPMAPSSGLHRAALRHSQDMLWREYFAHTSPMGSTIGYRIQTSGFVTYGAWWAGETLAWGSGSTGSPQSVVKMWLMSPEHRAILLSPRYHLVGIGRAQGAFLGHPGATVWTVDWGHR
jgi:uncharacterized protein YkwD